MNADSVLPTSSGVCIVSTREDETTPLIAPLLPTKQSSIERREELELSESKRRTVTFLIFSLTVFLNIPSLLQESSQVQIFENICCTKYYHDKNALGEAFDDKSCKIDGVQASVALLRGWKAFFNFLPGVLLCVPYGMLADRLGRKWILVMNQVAINAGYIWVYLICYSEPALPIRLIWLEGAAGLFGGGRIVGTALLFVIISDVTPAQKIAVTFFRLGAASYLCFLISYSIAGKLMEFGVWLPYTIGVCMNLLTIPLTLILPETLENLRHGRSNRSSLPNTSSSDSLRPPNATQEQQRRLPSPTVHMKRTRPNKIIQLAHFLATNFAFLQDWRILFLALSYPVRESLYNLDDLYFQYVPKRYGWSIAQTNYIYAFQAACAIGVLLVILPGASSILVTRLAFTPRQKEIFIARLGISVYALGTLFIGLAPNFGAFLAAIAIQTCGSGMGGATRALLTSFVKPNEVARIYTLLGLVEAVSLMVSAPIEASLFNFGMEHGGWMWLGLPWFLMSVCLFLLAIAFWSLKLDKKSKRILQDGV